MYVGTSKGTSTYWFYDFPENRRSPVYDAIQENHPRKRLVQSFLYALILYKTPIQAYRKMTSGGCQDIIFWGSCVMSQ